MTNYFVFEMIYHLDHQIDIIDSCIKTSSNEGKRNAFKKERSRYIKIRKSLKSIKNPDRPEIKFTTKCKKVKDYIHSHEFNEQLALYTK